MSDTARLNDSALRVPAECTSQGQAARTAPRAVVDSARIASLRTSGASWRTIAEELGMRIATCFRHAQQPPAEVLHAFAALAAVKPCADIYAAFSFAARLAAEAIEAIARRLTHKPPDRYIVAGKRGCRMHWKSFAKWLLCFLLVCCTCVGQQLSKRMTNQDVIDMVSLGLPNDVIIEKIRTVAGTDFDTSVPGLRALKAGRVSDSVIRIMINPSLGSNPMLRPDKPEATVTDEAASPKENESAPPNAEVGVYLVRNGKLTEVQPEIVNWQTGGVLKHTATLGIVKEDRNGKVVRSKSPTQTPSPLEFLIKTLEGTSVEEYQLLRLHEKSSRREFRSVTGGILHVSGGAQRDEVAFQPEKIGNRTWKITMRNLPNGEYGFLPPGVGSESISASGKMYTFGVTAENRTQASRNISLLPPPPPETPPTPTSTVAPVPASPVVAPVSSPASEPPAPVVKSEPPPAPTETAVETKQKKPAYQCTEYTVDRLGLKNCTKWLLK